MNVKFLCRSLPCVALLGVVFLTAGVADAAHIAGVTIDSSTPGEFGGLAAGAIDGSGLDGSEPPQHQGAVNTVSEYFLTWNDTDNLMDSTFFVLDLNGTYDVGSLRFWNLNAPDPNTGGQGLRTGRGYTQVNVAFSTTDNVTFGAAQSFFPNEAPGLDGYEGELFPLTTAVGATFARLTFGDGSTLANEGNWGNENFAGFSEIQFYVIPEPATFSLLALSGMAMVGMRRKRVCA